jgi:hypothetical protein
MSYTERSIMPKLNYSYYQDLKDKDYEERCDEYQEPDGCGYYHHTPDRMSGPGEAQCTHPDSETGFCYNDTCPLRKEE